MITKSKIEDIKVKIAQTIRVNSNVYIPSPPSLNQFSDGLKYAIEESINRAVTMAFHELLDEIYTQEEFEHDVGLTK